MAKMIQRAVAIARSTFGSMPGDAANMRLRSVKVMLRMRVGLIWPVALGP